MIGEKEIWACANTVLDQHGGHAPVFVAERIAQLALDGDREGVLTWKAIARRIDSLVSGPDTGRTQ